MQTKRTAATSYSNHETDTTRAAARNAAAIRARNNGVKAGPLAVCMILVVEFVVVYEIASLLIGGAL